MREHDWPDEARRAMHRGLTDGITAAVASHGNPYPYVSGVRYKVELFVDQKEDDIPGIIGAILTALAPHVTPTAPLRELADGWVRAENEDWDYDAPARNGYECANELQEVIDRA